MNVKTTYLLFFVATIIAITSAKAQVKVAVPTGTPTPIAPLNSSAILDVSTTAAAGIRTTYKGIYLPQVALTANNVYGLNTAGSAIAVNGMLIYNTATAGTGTTAVTPGIYIWNNSVWNLVNTSTIAGNNTNIYKGNGTLTGDRNVNQAGFNLSFTGGNVGISNIANGPPSSPLQVAAAKDPVRFVGLQPADITANGTLVTNNTGLISIKSANTMSAVRVTGVINMTSLETQSGGRYTDISDSATKTFDNLNEFSGHIFRPKQQGLYLITIKMNFNQVAPTDDDGRDGYLGRVTISARDNIITYGKITLPETNHYPSSNTVNNTFLTNYLSGPISFQFQTFGTKGAVSANYVINILRID